jgi:hypothetical protein
VTLLPPSGTDTYLKWTGTAYQWATVTASGEANTASNQGSGSQVFLTKSGVDLQFRTLAAGSTKMTVAQSGNLINFDVAESVLNIANMTGTLPVTRGGTGVTSYAAGDILYATAVNTLGTLAKGGTSTVLKLNASGTLGYAKVDLTADVTGTLPVGNGGTGAATLATKGLLVGNGTAAVSTIAVPTTAETYLKYDGTTFAWAPVSEGGSGAPTDASYLVLSGSASLSSLSNERVLAGSATISVTDGGANGNATLAVVESGLTLQNMGGKLTVAKGGTGADTLTPNGVLLGNGTAAVTAVPAPTTAGQVLTYSSGSIGWAVPAAAPVGGGGAFTGPFVVTITVGTGGSISAINAVPSGWTVTGAGSSTLTVSSHNVGLEPRTVVFRGMQSATVMRVVPMIASGTHYIGLAVGTETSAFTIPGLSTTGMGAVVGQTCQINIYF